jgi:hypothetical protein
MAQPLLLVDDGEGEVGEGHAFAEKGLGAHDEADRPVLEAVLDPLGLGRRGEAGQVGDLHPQALEAALEAAVVLAGEDRRGGEEHGLPAREDGGGEGPDRDLGLAEAHVADDEAVHGRLARQVGEDLGDGAGLVGRFLEGEAGDELS